MTYRRLLAGNADFRRLWLGQVVSEVGDWLNNISVLALAIELAGDGRVGLALAVYAIARHLPLFLFGPVAGVVVDRLSRRRVMIAADLLRAALALGFLFAERGQSLGVIYAVGAALFSVAAFFNAAKRAAVPNVVGGTEELLAANSLTASTTAATIAVGSALGGVVATLAGRDLVFVLNAITFLASAELIRRIRTPTERRAAGGGAQPVDERGAGVAAAGSEVSEVEAATLSSGVLASVASGARPAAQRLRLTVYAALRRAASEFHDGLRYVRREPVLLAIFVAASGWGLGNGAARSLYSIFGARLGEQAAEGWGAAAREFVTRPGEFGISVLFVAMGVGGVLGAPLARRFSGAGGPSLGARLGRSMALDGCGLAVFSLMPNLWGAAAVLVAREVNFAVWWTSKQTIMMRRVEDVYAGRVFASYETLTTLTMVGSMLVSGEAADRLGIRPVAFAGGLVITCSGLLWLALLARTRAAAGAEL